MENAKIALIQFCISPPKTDMENNIIVSDYQQMDRILKEERNYILSIVKKIKQSGCNVVLIQKSILRDATTDMALHYLAKAKIMVVKDIERDEVEFISKTLNCRPIAHVDHMKLEKLGQAALVEEKSTGSGRIVKISGIVDQGKTASVLLRGSNKLVLDEADRILDEGFKKQIGSILGSLPKQRRTGLFSATQTEEVKQLARAGLRNPFRVVVRQQFLGGQGSAPPVGGNQVKVPCAEVRVPSQLTLQYLVCSPREKLEYLVQYLKDCLGEKGIVYLLTCACVEFCAKALKGCGLLDGHDIWPLHGRMKQSARNAALQSFEGAKSGVLLCTDVAARGLDIPSVQWIIQLDPPQDPSFFIHRVGRTARMGNAGRALLFLNANEETYVTFLQKRKVPVTDRAELKRCDEDLSALVRKMNETDRDMLDKSVRAFVTYIRAYTEHQCQYIFRLTELDVGSLGDHFALLRLPKMKEFKRVPSALRDGFTGSTVDPSSVPYLDKNRERQRKEKQRREAEARAKVQAEASSSARAGQGQGERRLPAARRRKVDALQDDLELEEDYRLFSMLRRGKITEEEYDERTMESAKTIQKEMDKKRVKKKKRKRK